jgi:hypothetical protein
MADGPDTLFLLEKRVTLQKPKVLNKSGSTEHGWRYKYVSVRAVRPVRKPQKMGIFLTMPKFVLKRKSTGLVQALLLQGCSTALTP